MNCSLWPSALQSYCQQANAEYSLPASTVYCHSNPIAFSLKNYIPIHLELRTQYSNGVSAVANITQPIYLGGSLRFSSFRQLISSSFRVCYSFSVAGVLRYIRSSSNLSASVKLTGEVLFHFMTLFAYFYSLLLSSWVNTTLQLIQYPFSKWQE